MGLIDMIAAERLAVADVLEGLDADGWSTPSLCQAWTVKEVAAHLVVPFEVRTGAFIKALVLQRGNFDRVNAEFARRISAVQSGEYLVRTLRENRYHPFTPPGSGLEAPLCDVVVHGEDIRRPLGLGRTFESETLATVLGFLTSGRTRGFVPGGRLEGLAFEAPDAGWRWGTGAVVRGPGASIALALCGRPAGLEDLSGEGVVLLRSRLAP